MVLTQMLSKSYYASPHNSRQSAFAKLTFPQIVCSIVYYRLIFKLEYYFICAIVLTVSIRSM